MIRKSALIPFLLLLSTFPLWFGCSSSDSSTNPTPPGVPGHSVLRVNLTDKPAEQYLAVKVTIVAVRIHLSSSAGELDAGWEELPVAAAMPVDLLTLRNGVLYELCKAQLRVGHYQQVRLVLAPNAGAAPPFNQSVVTADSVAHALDVPSATIKIVHGFSVKEAGVTELTLDFDAAKSIIAKGNGTYSLKPVIKATSKTAT